MDARESAGRPGRWMLGGALAFAAMGALTHALGPRCDWLVVALVRAVFMFAATASLARSAGVPLVVWRPRMLWVRSLAGSFSLVCNFFALTHLPVAEALTLSNAYPLWIVLMSALIVRRAPRPAEVLAVACGLAGVALMQRPHLDLGAHGLAASVALLSSVSTAVAMLGLHQLRHVDTRAVVAHFAGVASLVALTWIVARPDAVSASRFDPTTAALLLGVAATGTLGQFCLTRAYSRGAPSRMSVIGLSQVAFAMVFDVVLWGRALTPLALAGVAMVIGPSAWVLGARRPQPA